MDGLLLPFRMSATRAMARPLRVDHQARHHPAQDLRRFHHDGAAIVAGVDTLIVGIEATW